MAVQTKAEEKLLAAIFMTIGAGGATAYSRLGFPAWYVFGVLGVLVVWDFIAVCRQDR